MLISPPVIWQEVIKPSGSSPQTILILPPVISRQIMRDFQESPVAVLFIRRLDTVLSGPDRNLPAGNLHGILALDPVIRSIDAQLPALDPDIVLGNDSVHRAGFDLHASGAFDRQVAPAEDHAVRFVFRLQDQRGSVGKKVRASLHQRDNRAGTALNNPDGRTVFIMHRNAVQVQRHLAGFTVFDPQLALLQSSGNQIIARPGNRYGIPVHGHSFRSALRPVLNQLNGNHAFRRGKRRRQQEGRQKNRRRFSHFHSPQTVPSFSGSYQTWLRTAAATTEKTITPAMISAIIRLACFFPLPCRSAMLPLPVS